MSKSSIVYGIEIGTSAVKIASVEIDDYGNKIGIINLISKPYEHIEQLPVLKGRIQNSDLVCATINELMREAAQHFTSLNSENIVCIGFSSELIKTTDTSMSYLCGDYTKAKEESSLDSVYDRNNSGLKVLHVLNVLYKQTTVTDNYTKTEHFSQDMTDDKGSEVEVKIELIEAYEEQAKLILETLKTSHINADYTMFTGYAAAVVMKSLIKDSHKKHRNRVYLLIDGGAGTTTYSLYNQDRILYSNQIKIGTLNIANDLYIDLKSSFEDALEMSMEHSTAIDDSSINYGIDVRYKERLPNGDFESKTVRKDRIEMITSKRIKELIELIFIDAKKHCLNISEIILSGSLSRVKNIEEAFKIYNRESMITIRTLKTSDLENEYKLNPVNIHAKEINYNFLTPIGLAVETIDFIKNRRMNDRGRFLSVVDYLKNLFRKERSQ